MSSALGAGTEVLSALSKLLGKSSERGQQSGSLTTVRETSGCKQAVVFLHGFCGNRDDTWDSFPSLIGTMVTDWDIFTMGYGE